MVGVAPSTNTSPSHRRPIVGSSEIDGPPRREPKANLPARLGNGCCAVVKGRTTIIAGQQLAVLVRDQRSGPTIRDWSVVACKPGHHEAHTA